MDMDDKILSNTTNELLERVNILKCFIKNGMIDGDVGIIEGITLFEDILIQMNPDEIDDSVVSVIENKVNEKSFSNIYLNRRLNYSVGYGIDRCFLILETYNSVNKYKKLERTLIKN